MQIRQATQADLPEVLRVFSSARDALKTMGIDQWQHPGVPDTGQFPAQIEAGRAWVVVDCLSQQTPDRLIGFMTMTPGPDPVYNVISGPGWANDNAPYLALHRLAVDSAATGRGVGKCMIRFAQHQAATLGPDATVRLDTHPDNRRMKSLVTSLGFTYTGLVMYDIPGERRRHCYEIPAATNECGKRQSPATDAAVPAGK